MKHIAIKYNFNRDNIEKKLITLKYIESKKMLADILIKYANNKSIYYFVNQIFSIPKNRFVGEC